jgi:hypothetical protein
MAQRSRAVPIKPNFGRNKGEVFGFTFWTGHNTPQRRQGYQGLQAYKVAGKFNFTGKVVRVTTETASLIGDFRQEIQCSLSSYEKYFK